MLASVLTPTMVYAQPFPVKPLRFQLTRAAVMFGDGMSGTQAGISINRSPPANVPPQPSRSRAPPEWLRRWRTLLRPVLVFVREFLVAAASLVWMCSRRRHPFMDELTRQTLTDQRRLDHALNHAPHTDPSDVAMQLLSSPLHRILWPATWQNEIETCPHDRTRRYGAPTACTDKSVRLYARFLRCEQCGAMVAHGAGRAQRPTGLGTLRSVPRAPGALAERPHSYWTSGHVFLDRTCVF